LRASLIFWWARPKLLGKEDSQAAQVTIDGVSRKPSILSMVEAVIGETPLLLKIENEPPNFMLTDLSYLCAYSL
jgi:hypothetical protein